MPTTFAGLVNEVIGIINIIIPLIFGILFLYLVWRVFENWVLKADDQNAREAGPALIGVELTDPKDYKGLIHRMEKYGINYTVINEDPDLFQYFI